MKLPVFLLIITAIVFITCPKFFSQTNETEGIVETDDSLTTGDVLTISYELKGNLNEEYDVRLFVLSKGNYFPKFEPKEKFLHGDIGRVLFKGTIEKNIIWEYKKEIIGGLDEDDLKIKITYEESGGSTWYYYVGAAIIGAVTGFLISNSSECTDCPDNFANPPTRPSDD